MKRIIILGLASVFLGLVIFFFRDGLKENFLSKVKPSNLALGDQVTFRNSDFPLNEDDVQNDIGILRFLISEHYVGKSELSEAAFNELLEILNQVENQTFKSSNEFCTKLNSELDKIKETGLFVWHPLFCNISKYPLVDAGAKAPLWSFNIKSSNGRKFGVVTIPSTEITKLQFDQYISTLKRVASTSDVLFLDVRGMIASEAGANSLLSVITGVPFNNKLFSNEMERGLEYRVRINNNFTETLLANSLRVVSYWPLASQFLSYGVGDIKIAFDEVSKRDRTQKGITKDIDDFPRNIETLKNQFNKPLWILADKSCIGGCEFFVHALGMYPDTKIIGTNTFGNFQYKRLGMLKLPSSDLIVNFPTEFVKTRDNYAEKTGIVPDKKIDGQISVDRVLELIP